MHTMMKIMKCEEVTMLISAEYLRLCYIISGFYYLYLKLNCF